MLVSDFNYNLPPELIAQRPLEERTASRLLHLDRQCGIWRDRFFRDFPDILRPDDLLVLNNTRVFAARLCGHRSGQRAQAVSPHNPAAKDFLQGQIEVLLTRQVQNDPNEWECLVRPGRKIGVGEKLYFSNSTETTPDSSSAGLEAEVVDRGSFGERRIRFAPVPDFFARVEQLGHVPLPPYIHRENDSDTDRDRYQTVYARERGSVAAPTAGLHFTPEILERIRARGIEIAEITLHVGLGTFQPVRAEKVEDHKLHREHYEISEAAALAINQAKAAGRRVVAVGTTTVRTLEFAALRGNAALRGKKDKSCSIEPGCGDADIFIYPGYRFQIVEALLTNFHLPQSTLLMLVCALGGKELVMSAYHHAIAQQYRFYSYGDCMFLE
jgi:S-adenosylmethionine:tRNA ribosyltransferase-isomerase